LTTDKSEDPTFDAQEETPIEAWAFLCMNKGKIAKCDSGSGLLIRSPLPWTKGVMALLWQAGGSELTPGRLIFP